MAIHTKYRNGAIINNKYTSYIRVSEQRFIEARCSSWNIIIQLLRRYLLL